MSVLGLVSTVTSLRGWWQLADLVLPPDRLLPSLLPGILAGLALVGLRVSSSLHGGVAAIPAPGSLWPGWLTTAWLIQRRFEENQEESEVFVRF